MKGLGVDLGSADVAGRTFALTRKGYDRDEVALFLRQVAAAMTELQDALADAERSAEQRSAQLRDLEASGADGFHRSLAADVATVSTAPRPSPPAGAAQEAERIVGAANDHYRRLRHQAEEALQRALATAALIEADQERMLVEAQAERDSLLGEATTEAADIVAGAKHSATATRAEAQRFAEQLRELTATETIELVSYAKEMAAAILESAGNEEIGISLEGDDLTIELRDPFPVRERHQQL